MNELTVPNNRGYLFWSLSSLINLFDYLFTSAHTDCMVKLLKSLAFKGSPPKRMRIIRYRLWKSTKYFNVFCKNIWLTCLIETSRNSSLAMSYSHMGKPHTTIGAIAFHFWVRQGVRWVHNAMVAKQNRTIWKVLGNSLNFISTHKHAFYFKSEQNPLGVVWLSLTGN